MSGIQELDSGMFLVGFNYFDLEDEANGIGGKYPVFVNQNL